VNGDVGSYQGAALGGCGLSGGTVVGSHTISSDRGYLSNGSIGGDVKVRFTGESRKYGSSTLNMTSGMLINDGHLYNEVNGYIDLDAASGLGGGAILNRGLWELEGKTVHYNTHGEGRMVNEGIFRSLGGSSTLNQNFENTGSLEVNAGTIYLRGGSTHTGSVIANGGVSFANGTHMMEGPGGNLGGASWVYGTLGIRNGARLAPGNSTGTIHVAGALNFSAPDSTPLVVIEIAGTNDHDVVALKNSGSLSLGNGVAGLQIVLGYEPVIGDRFRIVDAGASNGSFSGRFMGLPNNGHQVSGIFRGAIHQFEISYDPAGKYIELEAVSQNSPYDDSAVAQGLTGEDAGYLADPDGDGFSNGIEFLFGGNPSLSSAGIAPVMTIDDDLISFSFRHAREASYLNPAVGRSNNLESWKEVLDGVSGVVVTRTADGYGPGIDRVEVALPSSDEIRFFLRVGAP
jgi:hypothetical protein